MRERPHHWDTSLTGLAINAWWLREPVFLPCDLTAFEASFAIELEQGDGSLTGEAVVRLWVAAFLKWPRAIKAWRVAAPRVERGVSARSRLSSWASAARSVAKACSGHQDTVMHDSISAGRMAAVMGAQVFLQKVGQCLRNGNGDGLKGHVVTLGKQQQAFHVTSDTGVWAEILKADTTSANPLAIHWPIGLQRLSGIFLGVLWNYLGGVLGPRRAGALEEG